MALLTSPCAPSRTSGVSSATTCSPALMPLTIGTWPSERLARLHQPILQPAARRDEHVPQRAVGAHRLGRAPPAASARRARAARSRTCPGAARGSRWRTPPRRSRRGSGGAPTGRRSGSCRDSTRCRRRAEVAEVDLHALLDERRRRPRARDLDAQRVDVDQRHDARVGRTYSPGADRALDDHARERRADLGVAQRLARSATCAPPPTRPSTCCSRTACAPCRSRPSRSRPSRTSARCDRSRASPAAPAIFDASASAAACAACALAARESSRASTAPFFTTEPRST